MAKLADRDGTRTAVREFGAPATLVGLLAAGIPPAELIVAALLLYGPTRAIGGGGALGLLILFSGAIAVRLARGKAPECHCFGQLHSEPVSWKTLARNGVLAVFAVTAFIAGIAGETPSPTVWIRDVNTIGLLIVVFTLTLVGLGAAGLMAFLSLLRSHGRVLLRVDQLERRLNAAGLSIDEDDGAPEFGRAPGTDAPAFAVADTEGRTVSTGDLLGPGQPLLLIFTSPGCGPCKALFPKIASWQRTHSERLTIAVLNGGDRKATIAEATEHGLEHMLIDHDLAVFEAYRANGTPSAVLVAPDGSIASYVAGGTERVERLVETALAEKENEQQGPSVGTMSPELVLPALDGEPLNLGRLREQTVLLFWNPACGFCNSMREDLLAWERNVPAGAPRLLIVSSGDEASVRAEGFSSSVALDTDFRAGAAFGAGGTPMAILIDNKGRIASPLAAGAEAVFALAGGRSRGDAGRKELPATSAKR